MKQTAVCALIGMTNAFGAMDNQWLMWDKFTEMNGPQDLMTLQTQDLHG